MNSYYSNRISPDSATKPYLLVDVGSKYLLKRYLEHYETNQDDTMVHVTGTFNVGKQGHKNGLGP